MSTIEQLANVIVARLEQEVDDMHAEHFPDAPNRFDWNKRTKSLLVSFEGGSYSGDVGSLDPFSLERTVELGVTVITRGLRGKLGMANALERVRAALLGWEPTDDGELMGWSRLIPTAERFVGEDAGVWRFVMLFRTMTTVVGHATMRERTPFTKLELRERTCGQ